MSGYAKYIFFSLILSVVFTLSGCVPNTEFHTKSQPLEPGHGLVVLVSHSYFEKIAYEFKRLEDNANIRSPYFGPGVRIAMISLPKGTYYLNKLHLPNSRYEFTDSTEDDFQFTVFENTINYFGDIVVEFSLARIVDNQNQTEDYLDTKYPGYLEKYQIRYTRASTSEE